MSKLLKLLCHPKKIIIILMDHGFFNFLNDKFYLKLKYRLITGKPLSLEKPCAFNEKLQWLKLYDRKDIYTTMVDKYEAKKYVADKIGEEYIIPTLGVYNCFDDIDFDMLPNQFVMKPTQTSGNVYICKDKKSINYKKLKKLINRWLKRNYYLIHREWPYKNVKPKIIVEKYISDGEHQDLNDYKFMCFNGKVKCSFVCTERREEGGLKVTFFDTNWKKMTFERHYPSSNREIPKPDNYDKMLELAEILSKNIPFVRADFYQINGQIYFGELTFYPGSGFEEFTPESWDYTLGSWLKLP